MRGMGSHSSSASEASTDQKPSYAFNGLFVFLFALIIRVIIFQLGIASGGTFNAPSADYEPYMDYRILYLPLVEYFKQGYLPYYNFPYSYTPFFLYLLTSVSLLTNAYWVWALPLVVFDAASAVLVFLIASKFTTPQKALLASIAFALAPVNLYYNDYIWLNPPPMTFFALLAVYAFLSKKYEFAFYSLAIATLFKQIAIVLLPVFIFTLLNQSNGKQVIVNVAIFGTMCFLGSLPFIVTMPTYYFSNLLALWSVGSQSPTLNISIPINLAVVFGMPAYYGVQMFLWAAMLLSFVALCLMNYTKKVTGDQRFIIYVLYALLLFHVFLPRGMYKYYIASITPFCAALIRSLKTALVFLGFNMLVLMIPRIFTPWLLAVLLVFLLTKTYIRQGTDTLVRAIKQRVSSRPPRRVAKKRPKPGKSAKPESPESPPTSRQTLRRKG